jgi:DNA polymerase-1
MSVLIPGYERLADEELARQAAIHRVACLPFSYSYSAGDIHVITTTDQADAWAERLHHEKVSLLGIDCEFTYDRQPVALPNGKEFKDVSTVWPQVCSVVAWCAATTPPITDAPLIRLLFDLRRPEVHPGLRAVVDLHVPWVAHAARAEYQCLWACGVEPPEHLLVDTYVTAACLHMGRFHRKRRAANFQEETAQARLQEERRAHITSLVGQCEHYHLNYPYDRVTKDLLRERFQKLGPDDPLDDDLVAYAVADAEFAVRLHLAQAVDVHRFGLAPHLAAVEWPLVAAISRMEVNGLPVNAERMRAYRGLCEQITEVMAQRLLKFGITPGSRKSFLKRMHQDGVLSYFVRRGKYSTVQAVLKEAKRKGVHPAVRPFRLHRHFRQLTTDKMLAGELLSADGRQRCDLDQLRSVSGRIASSAPNMIGLDKRLRPIFEAPPGMTLVELDYGQMEVGVAGGEWHDEKLVREFNFGDAYAGIAKLFYAEQLTPTERALTSREFKQVRPELRNNVKSLVLGIFFGLGASRIAESFGCSLAHAEVELQRFFDLFPQARDGANRAVKASLARGYGLTVSGLRRFIEVGDEKARNQMRNHPVQGSAASCFKTALLRIDAFFKGTRTQLVLPRHDSILLLTPEDTRDEVVTVCRAFMVGALREKYPCLQPRVDPKDGRVWPTEQTLEDYFNQVRAAEGNLTDVSNPAG